MRRRFWKIRISHALSMFAIAALAFALAPLDGASAAYTYKRLHSFCNRTNCTDGKNPYDSVVMDQNGILYGTGSLGGKYDSGVVFKLVPNADKSRYTEYVLHNFCRNSQTCADGDLPVAGVILDVDGNIYGTAWYGGAYGLGTIFKPRHGAHGWALSVLKNFCAEGGAACTDGANPGARLSYAGQDSGKAWDGSSPLFGSTANGGRYNNGVAYELTSNGNYTVIHNFQTSAHPDGVLVDSAGNIYGTTEFGGKYGGGLMYKLASGTWSETVLHNFCNSQNCSDGAQPIGRLFRDSSGNLFGTTFAGGSNSNNVCGGQCGVVFERTSGGSYSVRYNLCAQTNCADGAKPEAGVIVDGSGNLFGTTAAGGNGNDAGTVYEISGSTESVLYSFCSQQTCTDGYEPVAGLTMDPSGGLLGTTYAGGTHGLGEVFRLGP